MLLHQSLEWHSGASSGVFRGVCHAGAALMWEWLDEHTRGRNVSIITTNQMLTVPEESNYRDQTFAIVKVNGFLVFLSFHKSANHRHYLQSL